MKRRVVVTGLGVVTSLSCQVEDLWTRIRQGESGIVPITLFDTARFKVKFAGEVTHWAPENTIGPREAKRLDRFAQFALVAANDAVKDSGVNFKAEDPYRCGVMIGSGIGGLSEFEAQHQRLLEKGPDKVSPFTIPKLMLNSAAGHVAIHHGLKGVSEAVATACASAANAIGNAFRAIQYGTTDVMITGGSEAGLTRMGLSGFSNMRALSERNDEPQKASRPFDVDRDGFVLSEGAGVIILEELEHAKARGARIYAEMLGYGASCDSTHITQPDENGAGAARAMEEALRDARKAPSEVSYINAHGTSTPLGDLAETLAVKRVFGESARSVSISSTKGHLGHLLGASGGVEIVFGVLSIRDSVVPPTINLDNPAPDCDLDYTPHTARERNVDVSMSNSFGFGGHNASLIVGKLA